MWEAVTGGEGCAQRKSMPLLTPSSAPMWPALWPCLGYVSELTLGYPLSQVTYPGADPCEQLGMRLYPALPGMPLQFHWSGLRGLNFIHSEMKWNILKTGPRKPPLTPTPPGDPWTVVLHMRPYQEHLPKRAPWASPGLVSILSALQVLCSIATKAMDKCCFNCIVLMNQGHTAVTHSKSLIAPCS